MDSTSDYVLAREGGGAPEPPAPRLAGVIRLYPNYISDSTHECFYADWRRDRVVQRQQGEALHPR